MNPVSANEILFRSWLRDHRGVLARVARSFAADPAQAAELEQEMMLQLWGSAGSFRGQAAPSTWIYRVCLNTALSWKRGDTRRRRHLDASADIGTLPASGASPAEAAASRDMLERLYAAIHAMPDFDRALILLSLDGLSYGEISEVTGMTENHVGVGLTRARKQLAQLMKGATDELE